MCSVACSFEDLEISHRIYFHCVKACESIRKSNGFYCVLISLSIGKYKGDPIVLKFRILSYFMSESNK